MIRMRTIDAALTQLRQDDPQCCLSRHALRNMVLRGEVPCVKSGCKYLINYDGLLAVLAGQTQPDEPPPDVTPIQNGRVRRIEI